MMWKEFEEIAGYEVSYEDYHNIIEPMYLAIPEYISKQDFVKMLDKKRFALKPYSKLKGEMRILAKSLKESCIHYTDYQTIEDLNERIQQYIARKYIYHTGYHFKEDAIGGCHYPHTIVIYDTNTYRTLEEIHLLA